MMDNISLRLNILESGGVINSAVKKSMFSIVELLFVKHQIVFTQDESDRFITHMAMAAMRVLNGDAFSNCNEGLKQEIMEDANYDRVLNITKEILEILPDLPEGEQEFVMAYLCSIL